MTVETTDDAGEHTRLLRAELISALPHVLIAEDQPAIRDLLCWTMQLAGYRTATCASRHDVLTWREQAILSGGTPVVLLLDLSLLGTNEAADFLRRLRARWQDAGAVLPQIIVLTTNTQVQADLGMSEQVLQKPFHVRELLALIRQVPPVASRSEEG